MTSTFGRTAAVVTPLLAAACLVAASIAHADTGRPGSGISPVRPPAGAQGRAHRHVKHNAGPGPVYYAGGATLPAVAYEGATQAVAGAPNPGMIPGPGTTGTIFGYFTSTYSPNNGADTITYCQTGSGFGKTVMNGDNDLLGSGAPQNANLPCATPVGSKSVAMVNGFGAVGQDFGDFSGSDAPLAVTEYNDWVTNSQNPARSIFGRGSPVQVPYIVGSIAILYNNSDPMLQGTQLKLSTAQVCKIADGEITNWNQLNKKYASKTLAFTVRSDKSGTSFSFGNYLNTNCKGAGETYGVSQNFDEYIPGNPAIGVLPNPLPPGATTNFFLSGSGNGGVVAAIEGQDGAIGYTETANALTAVGGNLNFSLVNKKDPVRDLPKSAGGIVLNDLLTSTSPGSDVANGRAALVALSPADNCVLLVSPVTYSKPKGYPIVAVTNLEFSQTGNGVDNTDLQALAFMMSQAKPEAVGAGKITSVDLYGKSNVGTTGYSTLNQKSFGAVVKQTALTCINP